jgi:NitT/TauT family transport system substrate-binding protein
MRQAFIGGNMSRLSLAKSCLIACLTLPVLLAGSSAQAEATKMTVAKGFGLGFIQLMIMEDRKLIEKHAKLAGLDNVVVEWPSLRSSDVMFDGLLSGTLQVASLGVPGLATIWDKTKGTPVEVKGLTGFNVIPWSLNTSEPGVTSIKDLPAANKKIAVPGVKVSIQARMLQMAAIKEWGKDGYDKLDSQTVSMTNPDGVAAFVSGSKEITTHFTGPPYVERELKVPGVRTLLTSKDIAGDVSFIILAMPTKFYQGNPKLVGAFMAALKEATYLVNNDKKAAAREYIRLSNDTTDVDEIYQILENKCNFTMNPEGTLSFFNFMNDIHLIKSRPTSWTEYMHPIAHSLAGN